MFDGKTFYHQTTRRAVIAFGVMFNNLYVRRKDSSGNVIQTLRVPLAYAAKDRMLARIQALPDADKLPAITTLPEPVTVITVLAVAELFAVALNNKFVPCAVSLKFCAA